MINKCKTEGLIYHNYPNTFIKYSNDIRCIFKNIDDYDHTKKHKTLTVFGDMIVDMLSDKKIEPIVMEPFISDRKLNTSLAFIARLYFVISKKY